VEDLQVSSHWFYFVALVVNLFLIPDHSVSQALCRVILNRTQAINVLCQKALSQASKEYHLPLPPALKKWRLPATGPVLSANVCVLLNDMREVRNRFAALGLDITAPIREQESSARPSLLPSENAGHALERAPPKPPKLADSGGVRTGFFSRLWKGKTAGSTIRTTDGEEDGILSAIKWEQAQEEPSALEESSKKKARGSKNVDKERTSGSRGKRLVEQPDLSACGKMDHGFGGARRMQEREDQSGLAMANFRSASADRGGNGPSVRSNGREGGASVFLFREAVVRSLSPHEKPFIQKLQKAEAEEKIMPAASASSPSSQFHGATRADGSAEKKRRRLFKAFGTKAGASAKGSTEGGAANDGTDAAEEEQLWADNIENPVSTSGERFSVIRMEIEKQYFELVRSVARMVRTAVSMKSTQPHILEAG
jgi:hypothetical protein